VAVEIERKFLVVGDGWRSLGVGVRYRQGYIPTRGLVTVRVRTAGDKGFLTVKGPTVGLSRAEYEYPIPVADANEMLDSLCDKPLIDKTRYTLRLGDVVWEVDEFHAENAGLVVAEVELADDRQMPPLPEWVGQEVSHDRRYTNASLSKHPFSLWGDRPRMEPGRAADTIGRGSE
jgi:CYTH domain-containing protein